MTTFAVPDFIELHKGLFHRRDGQVGWQPWPVNHCFQFVVGEGGPRVFAHARFDRILALSGIHSKTVVSVRERAKHHIQGGSRHCSCPAPDHDPAALRGDSADSNWGRIDKSRP